MSNPAREITATTLVEVARGRLKPFGRLTPAERRRASRLADERSALIGRWSELLDLLGEAWIPQTPFVIAMGYRDLPERVTIPELEDEIAKLETALEMKRLGTGSVN